MPTLLLPPAAEAPEAAVDIPVPGPSVQCLPEAPPPPPSVRRMAGRPQPHSRIPYKAAGADLRPRYVLTVEVGFLAALLILLAVFHLPFYPDTPFEVTTSEQEVVALEEILQTEQETRPPPPPRPPIPVEVPDDVVPDDVPLDLDATLDMDEPLTALPPLPAPPAEAKERPAAQQEEPEVFVVVEEMPELIGGIQSIQAKIAYPEIARRAGIEGRVFVQFVVDEQGRVLDPVVLRGIGGGCDEEALRAVSQARFKPGRQRGKPVRVRYVIPLVFKLQEESPRGQ